MADGDDKLKLLGSVKLFSTIPAADLPKLADLLNEVAFEDGATVFEEGDTGDALYFVTSGSVRIAKKLRAEGGETEYKELAVLGSGEAFGEMALIDPLPRSADALAKGATKLFKLTRTDLSAWLSANPGPASKMFTQLVQTLSGRLRSSSDELTLLFDLSHLLLEPFASPKDLLDKTMTRLMKYLTGEWVGGAYVYNEFNEEMDLIDVEGAYDEIKDQFKLSTSPEGNSWLDGQTYQVVFPGEKRCMGYLVFHRAKPLDADEQNEFARTLTTSARLITSALQNIGHRSENAMRNRLKTNLQADY
jgi:CRP-like cAMP-binding protein